MSPSSEALVELGHVKQESLADELARVGPTEGEYVDSGLTIATLLEELTHSDMDNPDASTPENNSARLPNPSQVVAPAPADHIQHNFSLNVSVDMSLETDAGNEDTPVDTPKTDGDEVDVSAGDEAGHTTTAPDSSSLSSFPSVSSSEMITNERADAFFADMTTDSFIGAREGLSAITEEDSGQVAPTAVELLAEESLDLTTDNSLGSQLLDVDLAVLGDSANSLDSDLDGPAARKVESRLDWADDNDLGRLEPMYDPPLIASAHTSAHAPAPSPAPLASSLALATATEVNPSEDRPERLRTTGLETSSRQKRPTLKPNDLHKLLVSNNRHNAARSGRAPPFVAASPSLPLFSSPSSPARLPIPSASDVATSRDQDEQKVGDSSTKTSQKRRKKNKSTPRQQAAHKTPVKGSSKSTWAPVGEDATGEGAPGEDDTGEGAPGEDDTGEGDTGEKARPKKRKRRSPANLRNRQQRHEEFIQKKQEEEQNRK
ncbi:hypothetical protein FRC12_007184 [Ceratobasidium sp. 428]|nr:hypothetical protein FRC12_007184 [Ceratobasidium sp. 428]